jgi:hypothetical protein
MLSSQAAHACNQIVIGAGEAAEATEYQKKEAAYAKIIQPIRENGNLLLCTLLLGNVAVNALLSIIMAEMSGGESFMYCKSCPPPLFIICLCRRHHHHHQVYLLLSIMSTLYSKDLTQLPASTCQH